jgi:histidinol phosphatase-like PHP family hydrolase
VKGTNLAALKIPEVNILAHPGLITIKEAELAKENDIFLELTAREGHCFSNGHIAKVAMQVGNKLLVNSDAHSPRDLFNEEKAFQVAFGSGLSEKNSKIVTRVNPKDFIGSI